ncbi:MAG: ribonuclease toxin immunity protein CdiI [Waterburya sp.]
MTTNLFNNIDIQNDFLWIVKNVFESLNNSHFLERLELLITRQIGGGYPCGFIFSEQLQEDKDPFNGVLCWYFEEKIIVSEQEFYDVMVMACQRYIELNPKSKQEVETILAKWQLTES